jgi:hypothetical protein
MYDPDSKDKIQNPRPLLNEKAEPAKRLTYQLSDILPDKIVFKWQLQSSQLIRNAHGIGMEKGKVVVTDKAKLEKLEEWKKEIVRQYWRETNGSPPADRHKPV